MAICQVFVRFLIGVVIMANRDLKQLIEWGRYKRAVVKAVQLGNLTGYHVIDPGRLNGYNILDPKRFYRMDDIVAITRRINRAAGRENSKTWAQLIDQA